MLCSNTTRVLNRITKYKVGFKKKKKKSYKEGADAETDKEW